jgi:hypothetical protein
MLLILEPSSRAAQVTVDDSVFDFKEDKKKRPNSAKEIHVDPEDLRFRSKEGDISEDSRRRSSTPLPKSQQRSPVDLTNFKTPSMASNILSLKRGSLCTVQLDLKHKNQQKGESAESGVKHQVDKLMKKLHVANVPFALIKESANLLKCVDNDGNGQGGSAYEVCHSQDNKEKFIYFRICHVYITFILVLCQRSC